MNKHSLKTKIKGLIFDFDGVLIDSPRASMERVRKAAEICDVKVPDQATLRKCWEQSWEEIIPNLMKAMGWSQEETLAMKAKIMELLDAPFEPIPGLNDMLRILRKKGILLAIVSARPVQSLMDRAREVKIDLGLFSWIQASDTYQYCKPDPRVFRPTLQVFSEKGIKPEEVVMIGDTVVFDYQAAAQHEPALKFIAIVSAVSSKEDFVSAGLPEKLILRTAAAVPQALQHFN